MEYNSIYKKTEEHVTELFEQHQPAHLLFHNLDHTKNVVSRANEIAGHYQLTEQDMLIVFVAAWFHDTGYLFVAPREHEVKSVEIMREFMKDYNLPSDITDAIEGCILATRPPRNPVNDLQEIICDADTYHFGKKEFKLTNKLTYNELKRSATPPESKKAFLETTLLMMQQHNFYTRYCIDLLNEQKNQNMKKLKKQAEKSTKEAKENDSINNPEITEKEGTRKGMQTMLRLTSSNHIQLSEMADSKANILISVNAIIISVILSVLLRKLQTDPYLTIPTIIFLVISVSTIVVAILATRPKLSSGTFNDEDVINKKTNLLFFGNFHKMQWEEYQSAMRIMMRDSDYLYGSMVQDIYHLGAVLGKKYKLVRLAYNIFMFGIIISVLAFAVASFFYSPDTAATTTNNNSGSPF